ncbi:MAG: STAS domain-containing protein [Sedimentisphaerales bacterium]|nr:STAS domain-containing protein [Sedimentisphaerales bacterium]
MKITHQSYNNVVVVEIHGEFLEEYCRLFQDTMNELLKEKVVGIVLDMSNSPFIDSSGLGMLLWLRDYCHEKKSQLKLAGLDSNIKKILEITRLDTKLDRYEDLSEAVKSFT